MIEQHSEIDEPHAEMFKAQLYFGIIVQVDMSDIFVPLNICRNTLLG